MSKNTQTNEDISLHTYLALFFLMLSFLLSRKLIVVASQSPLCEGLWLHKVYFVKACGFTKSTL